MMQIFFDLMIALFQTIAIVLCLACCGLGVVRLVGLRQLRERVLIAPVMALSLVSILIGIAVQIGIPIHKINIYFWSIIIALIFLGIKDVFNALTKSLLIQMAIAFLATATVLHGFMYHGLVDFAGSPALDGWSYVSFGEYLRVYPRGTEGGLAPLYQYASHLSCTRYIASAMLAVLVLPGMAGLDTQMTVGPFLIIVIYSYACSVGYITRSLIKDDSGLKSAVTILLATCGGWLPWGIIANNYDNLLWLAFVPALFALAAEKNLFGRGRYLAPAFLIAAALYIYPEVMPITLAAYILASLPFIVNKTRRRDQVVVGLKVFVFAVLLSAPYLTTLVHYFINQLGSAVTSNVTRPGEGFFPDLLVLSKIPVAIWGFRCKTDGIAWLGGFGFIILAMGCVAAIRMKLFSLVAYFSLLAAIYINMIVMQQYDYGAYKALLFCWWLSAILLVLGGSYFLCYVQRFKPVVTLIARCAVFLMLLFSFVLWGGRQALATQRYPIKTITPFRELKSFIKQSGVQGFSVDVANATKNAWLVYELRNEPVVFTEYHGYMDQPHTRPLMDRSSVPDQKNVNYLVVEKSKLTIGEVVWQNLLFKIFNISGSKLPVTVTINAPNGEERLDGDIFFWIGHDPAELTFEVGDKQTLQMDIELRVGPSANISSEMLQLSIEQAQAQALVFDPRLITNRSISLNLSPGTSKIMFRSVYNGGLKANPNGDPRVLMIGVKVKSLRSIN